MKQLSNPYHANVSDPKWAEILKSEIKNGIELEERGFSYGGIMRSVTEPDFIEIYFLLKQRGYSLRDSIIHDVIETGYLELLAVLITDNYNINIKDSNNENALFSLVKRDHTTANFKKILTTAIAMGADFRHESRQGENLLHAFAHGGCPDEFLYELLTLDLDINKVNVHGWTPLHLLCINRIDDGAIETLIDYGADTTLKIQTGQYLNELLQHYDDTEETSCTAYGLRMKYINSIGGEYSEGTEAYETLVAKYKELFKENE